jgi:hypothetical protein
MKLAVNAKPDLNIVLLGADMDVAGAFPDRLAENGIDQPNHRRLPGHILKRGHLDVCLLFFFFRLRRDDVQLHRFQHTAQTGLDAIEAADQLAQFALRANRGLHLGIGQHFNRVERIDIQRVGGADGEKTPLLFQGRNLIFLCVFERNHLGQAEIEGILVRVVFFDLQLPAEHLHHQLLADNTLPYQKLSQLAAAPGLIEERLFELLLRQQGSLDQHLA